MVRKIFSILRQISNKILDMHKKLVLTWFLQILHACACMWVWRIGIAPLVGHLDIQLESTKNATIYKWSEKSTFCSSWTFKKRMICLPSQEANEAKANNQYKSLFKATFRHKNCLLSMAEDLCSTEAFLWCLKSTLWAWCLCILPNNISLHHILYMLLTNQANIVS